MKVSIIGGGAMGTALLNGMLESGYFNPRELYVSNPHTDKLDVFKSKGVNVLSDNVESAKDADLVVIAVKPWVVEKVIKELQASIDMEHMEVCIIVAGIKGEEIKGMFNTLPRNLCIAMPNTALSVGESMTFIVKIEGESLESFKVFGKTGCVKSIEESKLPAVTALASCGIAFAMRYVRAATEGGVELGIKAAEGQQIVAQTLAGAVALLSQPGSHAEAEIDKVTTPGGITIKGLNAMEKAGFTNAVIEGLKASGK